MSQNNAGRISKVAKILIVDDHPVVREGLSAHIATQDGLEVCGEAEDIVDAFAVLAKTNPDVVIIDIALKTGSGLELIKRIVAKDKAIRIVVWSMYPENLYAERALRAGAMAYLHKGRATAEILKAINAVLSGKIYLSEDLSSKLLGRLVGTIGNQAGRSPVESLSDRELEVFKLTGRGLTTEQVSEHIHVSPKTVETYRARIKEKLGLDNFTELIQQAALWVSEND